MSLTVRVTFARPAFHGLVDGERVQWPPDPVRLLGALKSGAHAIEDSQRQAVAHDALRRLIEAPAPVIVAPQALPLHHPATYTERTGLPDRISSTYEERAERLLTLAPFEMNSSNRVLKPRDGVALAGRVLDYVIDLELSPEQTAGLRDAARYVGYFGRSEDAAVVEVSEGPPVEEGTRQTWYPHIDDAGQSRGWQSNTIEWMDANHARLFSGDAEMMQLPTLPATGYVRRLTYRTTRAQRRAEPSLTVIPLPSARHQHETPALLRRLQPLIPAGWRVLPLTASTHPSSRGTLVGLGFYRNQQVAETSPLPAAEIREHLDLQVATERQLTSLQPETWTKPARRWVSSTPLRGFPHLLVVEHAVQQEADDRLDAEARVVSASTHTRAARDHRWANHPYTDGLTQWWLTLEFAEPISGPVQLGASTEHGFGAFFPVQ